MTTTAPAGTPTTPRPTPVRAPLVPAAETVIGGQLAWLGFVWLAATVVYAVVIASVARWGEVDESLWQSVVAGWQRYVIFGAGVTIATSFLRMLVRNGVTRGTVASASTISMGVIAVLVGLWQMAGYAVERLVYEANDWTHALRSTALFGWDDLPRVGIDNALVVAAYYGSGWVVGICFYRWGVIGGLVRLLPALVPAALIELVVSPDFGGIDVDALASWRDRPNPAVTLALGGAVLAATTWAARRLTREAALH